jgi:hypothetical protein
MAVYIPLPVGGTGDQRAYFQENFKMELIGANYPVAETKDSSLYSIELEILDNPQFDMDYPVDNDNKLYLLTVRLERSADNAEIVSFGFPFNDTESMADWNLYLLYQALANAAIPEDEGGGTETIFMDRPVDDRWRNKRVYISFGLGVDMGYYLRPGTFITDLGYVLPAASVSLEWHVFNYLSLELVPIKARFMHDKENYLFTPGFAALIKPVFKPGSLMLELYGGAEYNLGLPFTTSIPWLSVMGGIQVGTRSGARSAAILDIAASYSLMGNMALQSDGNPYNVLKFSIIGGFKIGFGDL